MCGFATGAWLTVIICRRKRKNSLFSRVSGSIIFIISGMKMRRTVYVERFSWECDSDR